MEKKTSANRLQLFTSSKKLVTACYALTQALPPEELTNLTYFVRSAALKAHLAIVQGVFSKKNKARKKLLRQAKNHFTMLDAAVDLLTDVNLLKEEQTAEVTDLVSVCYQQLKVLERR